MLSNTFWFDRPCLTTVAIITSVKYDKHVETYELSLLGLGEDGFNYTNVGKAWMDEDDLHELMQEGELDFPQELCGMRIEFISDNRKDIGDLYE